MKMKKANSTDTALVIFIKNPVLGKAKTRIAATVGEEEALRIYMLLLTHTRQVADNVEIDRHLYYSHHIEEDEWSDDLYYKHVQIDGDLGARMRDACATLSKTYSKVVIIGSDCAQLTVAHINKAIESLKNNDVVLGPVYDGGYYLLAMRGYHPRLMTDINWSTDVVAAQTLAQADDSGLTHTCIDKLSDIDYYEDWEKYGLE